MTRMSEPALRAVILRAISDKHALTVSLSGHRPLLVDPLRLDEKFFLYWDAKKGLPQKHLVGLFTEAVDLGRSLEEIESQRDGGPRVFEG